MPRTMEIPLYRFLELEDHVKPLAVVYVTDMIMESEELFLKIEKDVKLSLEHRGYGVVDNVKWDNWNNRYTFRFEKDLSEAEIISVAHRLLQEKAWRKVDKLSKHIRVSIMPSDSPISPIEVNVQWEENTDRDRRFINTFLQRFEKELQKELDYFSRSYLMERARKIVEVETSQEALAIKIKGLEFFKNGVPFAGKVDRDNFM